MSTFRVMIGVPTQNTWWPEFGLCLTEMIMRLMRYSVPGYDKHIIHVDSEKGSMLPTQRAEIVRKAIERDCTHLFFVDSDQTFPDSVIHSLVKRGELVVGANVATKVLPPHTAPTARKKSVKPGFELLGDVVYTMETSKGLERVWRLGFGLMLINMKVFEKVPLKGLFAMKWSEDGEQYIGEDWHFSAACEAADIPIYVDHDISKLVGHVGACEYTHDMVIPAAVEELRRGLEKRAA